MFREIGDTAESEGRIMDKCFSRLAEYFAAGFTLKKSADFVRSIVNIRGEFQQLEVAFTTLLKSEEKSNALMSQAVDLAAKTPFDLKGVANGARQLLAYGFEAENVMDVMRRLGDVASGLGLPLERLTYLYGTTRVQGRLYARDMLQFTNSGIPLLDELAKMYNKTTAEINDMVSAGKIGFADVEKVIRRMTDEGGQFANLMEKQSKTITGQISNIGDAIDVMFNNIGKSQEGIINKTLAGVSWMVENYQKIGRLLGDAVIAFGSYKAALIAFKAVEAAAARATIAANAGVTVSYMSKVAVLRKVVAAQELLNKTMLANPYVLATTAALGLGAALLRVAKESDNGTRGLKNFNDYLEAQNKAMDESRQKSEQYIQVASDVNAADSDRMSAIRHLIELYPDILEQYGSEKKALENILQVKKELAAQEKVAAYFEDSNRLTFLQAELKKVQEAIKGIQDSGFGGEAIMGLFNKAKELQVEIDSLQKKMDGYAADFAYGPNLSDKADTSTRNVEQVVKEIKAAQDEVKRLREKAITGLTETEAESLKELTDSIQKLKAEYKTLTGGDLEKQMKTPTVKEVDVVVKSEEKPAGPSEEEILDEKIRLYETYAGRRIRVEKQLDADLEILRKAREKASGEATDILDDAIAGLMDQKLQNSGLDQFRTYEQQKVDIVAKYNEYRYEAEKEGNEERLRLINESERKALAELGSAMLMESDTWKRLISDLSGLTAAELKKMILDIEAKLPHLNLDPVNFQALVDNLNRAKEEIEKRNPFEAIVLFFDELKNGADAVTRNKAIEGIAKSFTSITEAVSGAGSALSDMFDSFGMEGMSDGLDSAVALMGDLQTAANGVGKILTGDILGGITDIIKGLANMVTVFNRIHDNRLDKTIEQDEKALNRLSDAYDELSEAVDKAYGKNAADNLAAMNANLEEQLSLIEEQKRLEEEKKDKDEDALEQYDIQMADIRRTMADNKSAALDAILGSDIENAISSFASAITDAWNEGKTASESAKDYVKEMLQQTVSEAIKAYMEASQQVQKIRQAVVDAMADDIISAEEQQRIEDMAAALAADIEQRYGWADELFKDTSEEENSRTAATRTALGASQESVDQSNGILTGIQGIAYDIREQQARHSALMGEMKLQSASILEEVMGIHSDTDAMRSGIGELKTMVKEIKSNVGSIADKGVKML